MKPCRVIVAGSRTMQDYNFLATILGVALKNIADDDIEIVSGGAKGADKLGEQYAKSRGLGIKVFPANWDTHGKAAGPIRNKQMAEYATHCITFWDGKSRGTKNMIDLANQHNLKLRIISI